mmetsp:Transcript_12523/g.20084  ORF Transcript_12523/g.20084 Transcript_12523/m.20084 type:complete len:82 (-) Transcript_12523:81-326(-)
MLSQNTFKKKFKVDLDLGCFHLTTMKIFNFLIRVSYFLHQQLLMFFLKMVLCLAIERARQIEHFQAPPSPWPLLLPLQSDE